MQLARIRHLFDKRQWDQVELAFEEMARVMDLPSPGEDAADSTPIDVLSSDPWRAYLSAIYLILLALWRGRCGKDTQAQNTLTKLYSLIDAVDDVETWATLRSRGGIYHVG